VKSRLASSSAAATDQGLNLVLRKSPNLGLRDLQRQQQWQQCNETKRDCMGLYPCESAGKFSVLGLNQTVWDDSVGFINRCRFAGV
jgi:hypothetical protein